MRWLQFGAFLPMFRAHGTETPREPWRFGDIGDPSYDTIVSFINLRYRLLPYLYTLQGRETHRHYTTMRALAFDFRHDPAVYDIDDQLMIGPALMIWPVTEPLFYGPDSTPLRAITPTWSVYLPAGCDWYDFWTGERHEGGRTIDAAAPLERLPIFVRAGSILLLGPVVQYAEQSARAPWRCGSTPEPTANSTCTTTLATGTATRRASSPGPDYGGRTPSVGSPWNRRPERLPPWGCTSGLRLCWCGPAAGSVCPSGRRWTRRPCIMAGRQSPIS